MRLARGPAVPRFWSRRILAECRHGPSDSRRLPFLQRQPLPVWFGAQRDDCWGQESCSVTIRRVHEACAGAGRFRFSSYRSWLSYLRSLQR